MTNLNYHSFLDITTDNGTEILNVENLSQNDIDTLIRVINHVTPEGGDSGVSIAGWMFDETDHNTFMSPEAAICEIYDDVGGMSEALKMYIDDLYCPEEIFTHFRHIDRFDDSWYVVFLLCLVKAFVLDDDMNVIGFCTVNSITKVN